MFICEKTREIRSESSFIMCLRKAIERILSLLLKELSEAVFAICLFITGKNFGVIKHDR